MALASAIPSRAAATYAIMQAVQVSRVGSATFVDFTLDSKTFATLATAGTQVDITFPNTRPAADLAQHIDMDNSLGRLSVSGLTGESNSTAVSLSLADPMDATLLKLPKGDGIRLCLQPQAGSSAAVVSMVGSAVQTMDGGIPAAAETQKQITPSAGESTTPSLEGRAGEGSSPGLYDLDAYDSDVCSLFKSLAVQSKANIVLIGTIVSKVTVHFTQAPIDRAIDMLAKAAGLSYVLDNGTYFIGADKDMKIAYPNESPHYRMSEKVYQCNYVDASTLASTIVNVYDKTLLHVSVGAGERSNNMTSSGSSISSSGGSSSGSSGGSSGSTASGGSSSGSSSPTAGSIAAGSSTDTAHASREVILYGDADLVDQAYALAEQIDHRRKQIKIDMEIDDVAIGDSKQLGIQWALPQFTIPSNASSAGAAAASSGGSTGSSGGAGGSTNEIAVQATVSALRDQNKAKLLAAPSITLLDGEQGYILIGQRISYPLLTGYSQASTPIFSVAQEEVGIYLQVQAQITGDDEIMLSVYPQVSSITGYLNVNGASYPQVSTREQQTTVRVHAGDKVVIGGLINDQETRDFQTVPFLSQIPFFGNLFKYHNDNKTRDEVIMTITPTLVGD